MEIGLLLDRAERPDDDGKFVIFEICRSAAFLLPGALRPVSPQEFNQAGRHLKSFRLRFPLISRREQRTDIGHECRITELEGEILLKLGPGDLRAFVFQVS